MPGEFDAKVKPYKGVDIIAIANEEVFKAATRGLVAWKDNLSTGSGATGTRRPWVNTGEARADLAMTPQQPAPDILVGGDVVQLFIAEFGRAPNNSMPPRDAIEEWVHEKGIAARGDKEFDGVVFAIMRGIAKNGIKGFAPGLKAGQESTAGLEATMKKRVDEELRRKRAE